MFLVKQIELFFSFLIYVKASFTDSRLTSQMLIFVLSQESTEKQKCPLFMFHPIWKILFNELNFIGKLLVFRLELIVLLLLQIGFVFGYERDFMKSLAR